VARSNGPPNDLLRKARENRLSPSGSGRPLSRQELAEAINAYLWRRHRRRVSLDEKYVGKLERGDHRWPQDGYREAFRAVLQVETDAELGFYIIRGSPINGRASASDVQHPSGAHVATSSTNAFHQPSLDNIEELRRGLTDALSEGAMARSSLDDWELAVVRYGRATRDRPAGVLLGDLGAELAELKVALHRHRSASALRSLTRVVAQMSGLMCLTLCKLDDRIAFRRWARTARLAADEAGDPLTNSWVLAQEAYGHYYSAGLSEALDVARHAQTVVPKTPCVGAALAAALEARACAAMKRAKETRAALGRAEEILSHLDGEALIPSAFSYNEAQLRFHEGNAYTHLGDARSAFTAQNRALALCAPGDYTDWAMTRLDRALCLAATGEPADAVEYATETLIGLDEKQRRGIIALRGHDVLDALPRQQRATSGAHELNGLLMRTTDQKGIPGQ
jgi:tetratricopeptide (TPR) repeat protein